VIARIDRAPYSTSCSQGLILTTAGNIVTNTAPMTGPTVVLMPPTRTITRMFRETAQSNWPGETTPKKANSQPAIPAIAADSPNTPILMADVRTPAACANGSASLIDNNTEYNGEFRMPDANSKAISNEIITHQATGVPRNSNASGKSGNVGPSRPWVPLVIFRSAARTVRTSVKTNVVIAK
jgi:hypothetical protein